MAHLLIVDDEESICWGLSRLAERMGHTSETAGSAEDGLALAGRRRPDAMVLDVRLPGMDGLTALGRFREQIGPVPTVVITAYGDLGTAVEAVRGGAFDYLTKPFDLKVVERTIHRAIQAAAHPPQPPGEPAATPEHQIVGSSPVMQEVFKRIALVAPSDACVHICGESGTGKELAARAIHRYSRRCGGPFVAVNVASLSPTVAESELFGHVRGAFTGAETARRGLLEQAGGGTIFLDEVADIPMPIQVKLLRALEHGEVLPVGAQEPVQADFRVLTATHRNLSRCVAAGDFRHDLYFRLITFEVEMPPLRERGDDLVELTEHFLNILSIKNACPRPAVAPETMEQLKRQPWHGNVRELLNAIEHAIILARGGAILPEHLPPPMPHVTASEMVHEDAIATLIRQWAELQLEDADETADLYDRLLKLVEPPLLEAAMRKYHGQCATAARYLGLHRTTLRKKLDQFGIGGE